MVSISDSDPDWKWGLMPFVVQTFHKNNSSSSFKKYEQPIRVRLQNKVIELKQHCNFFGKFIGNGKMVQSWQNEASIKHHKEADKLIPYCLYEISGHGRSAVVHCNDTSAFVLLVISNVSIRNYEQLTWNRMLMNKLTSIKSAKHWVNHFAYFWLVYHSNSHAPT